MHLPLHAFELRYRALVKDCLKTRSEFGVVLIERGHEVGGGDKAELAEPAAPASVRIDSEPRIGAWQLPAIAPLSPIDHQRLLEQDDADARLRLLTELATEAADVLAYRLSGG